MAFELLTLLPSTLCSRHIICVLIFINLKNKITLIDIYIFLPGFHK